MKAADIQVGGKYIAKVSGKLTTVRVDAIREVSKWKTSRNLSGSYRSGANATTGNAYDVTNLATGRKTTFRSAAKFRQPAKREPQYEVIKIADTTL